MTREAIIETARDLMNAPAMFVTPAMREVCRALLNEIKLRESLMAACECQEALDAYLLLDSWSPESKAAFENLNDVLARHGCSEGQEAGAAVRQLRDEALKKAREAAHQ